MKKFSIFVESGDRHKKATTPFSTLDLEAPQEFRKTKWFLLMVGFLFSAIDVDLKTW